MNIVANLQWMTTEVDIHIYIMHENVYARGHKHKDARMNESLCNKHKFGMTKHSINARTFISRPAGRAPAHRLSTVARLLGLLQSEARLDH